MANITSPFELPNRADLVIIGVVVPLFSLLTDLLLLISGGGLFSVGPALNAIQTRAPLVQVDGLALGTLFSGVWSLTTITIAAALNLETRKHPIWVALIVWTIAGGMIANAVYGPKLVQKYMVAHGYSRCASLDRTEGNGKSRVWFDAYVSAPSVC